MAWYRSIIWMGSFFMLGFTSNLMVCFWVGRRGVSLLDEECSNGVSVYDYPLDSVPSECLEEGSQFGEGHGSEPREFS